MTTLEYRARMRAIAQIEREDLGLGYVLTKRLWAIWGALLTFEPFPMRETEEDYQAKLRQAV